jgi:hypothetical protein
MEILPYDPPYAACGLAEATKSSTKKVSGSMGNATSHALPGYCLATLFRARSMLSACTATLKRAVPLLTWTEILIIPHTRFPRELAIFITP